VIQAGRDRWLHLVLVLFARRRPHRVPTRRSPTAAADWLLPPGSRNALNQPVKRPTQRTAHLDASPQPCAVLRALEPNHCSPRATATRRVPPTTARAHSILTSPDKDRNRGIRTGSGYPRPLPQFLRSQAEAILACDFFSVELLDGTQPYVLAVIEHVTHASASPD
jgi:hypothetical protein